MRRKSPVVSRPSNSVMPESGGGAEYVEKDTLGNASGPIFKSRAGKATNARCAPSAPVPGSDTNSVAFSARYSDGLNRKETFVPESSHRRTGRFTSAWRVRSGSFTALCLSPASRNTPRSPTMAVKKLSSEPTGAGFTSIGCRARQRPNQWLRSQSRAEELHRSQLHYPTHSWWTFRRMGPAFS